MSTTYRVEKGDTFSTISRIQYGTENEASLIRNANPGTVEPLTSGIIISIPDLPNEPQNKPQDSQADNPNEVSVKINGVRFRFWTKIKITRSIDTIDTISLSAPFEPSNAEFRKNFKPLAFSEIQVLVGGVPLFTGSMVHVTPQVTSDSRTVTASGYSKPGVLNDCTASANSFPLEFNGLKLEEISAQLLAPFGLSDVFDVDSGAIFERVACDSSKKVLSFLTELAQQRGLVTTNNEDGELLYLKSITSGAPTAILSDGSSPLIAVIPSFRPQSFYSSITGFEPAFVGIPGSQYTVKNELLQGKIRPLNFNIPDTSSADLKQAVEAKVGRMYANAAEYNASVDTWRDPNGKLWEPNTIIRVTSPSSMIYEPYDFLLRSVDLLIEGNQERALLNLVMPGAFSGEIPKRLPWEA